MKMMNNGRMLKLKVYVMIKYAHFKNGVNIVVA